MNLKEIDVTELWRHVRATIDEVVRNHTRFVLTRGGRPEAVLIPYADFARYQALDEQHNLAPFDRLMGRMAARHAAISDEEVATDVEAARAEGTRDD